MHGRRVPIRPPPEAWLVSGMLTSYPKSGAIRPAYTLEVRPTGG